MAIKMSDYINPNGFSILVNFPTKLKLANFQTNAQSGYVLDCIFKTKIIVMEFLKEKGDFSEHKIEQALQLVKLKPSLYSVAMSSLTKVETKKVELALALLWQARVIVCEHFFDELLYGEQEYFKRFFRNLLYKKNIKIILIESNMNFVCETVKGFYLFTKNGKSKYIDDFFDDEIYKYVDMPFTVELIKYFESCGHKVDHDVTFNEALKAIYRGVK